MKNQTQLSEYDQQALDFLNETATTFTAEFLRRGKHFEDDEEPRGIYKITLSRGKRKFTFNFGQSIKNIGFYYTKGVQQTPINRDLLNKSYDDLARYITNKMDAGFMNNGKSHKIHYPVPPSEYDVLACLTKYDPDTFENFCSEFGYDTDSRKAEKIYKAVVNEWENVCKLFTEAEIEKLQEIQ